MPPATAARTRTRRSNESAVDMPASLQPGRHSESPHSRFGNPDSLRQGSALDRGSTTARTTSATARRLFKVADEAGCEGIVSKRANSRYVSGRAKTWFKIKSFMTADYAVLGVERSKTGIPIALLATLGDKTYVGDAMIALAAEERAEFWAAVGRLGTPQSRLAGLGKRKGATWIKGGLVDRVRNLRGEAMLRHATLQTLDVQEPAARATPG